MEIKFQLVQDERKEAERTYFWRIRPRAERFVWIGLLIFSCAMLMFQVFVGWKFGFRRLPGTMVPIVLIGAAAGALKGMRRFDGPDYAEPQSIEITEEGLLAKNAFGRTASPTPWTRIGRLVETDRLVMLSSPWSPVESSYSRHNARRGWLPPRSTVYILPKRAFSTAEFSDFRTLLTSHLSQWARNPKPEGALTS